jgi:hypothetical protein
LSFRGKKIFVTSPYLPPLNEFSKIIEEVWNSKILTNNGVLLKRFESEMQKKLLLNNFVAVSSGTIAIQCAIKALDLHGEIITTAFSWIASVSAIKWQNCKPVFADIDSNTLNIDINDVEKKITEKTVAIMPVHVFGNPCDIEALEKISRKYNLKIIYDAAHAVGSTYNGMSVLNYGDISATSLHATKIINTGEGGGCIVNDNKIAKRIERIRFFGFDENNDVVENGFNGKMSEIHAALGLANLKYLEEILEDRKNKYEKYYNNLSKFKNLRFQKLIHGSSNYSSFPIIFNREDDLINVLNKLNEKNIYARRYFYPSLNKFEKILPNIYMPVSEDIAQRILCLPLFKDLHFSDIDVICDEVDKVL